MRGNLRLCSRMAQSRIIFAIKYGTDMKIIHTSDWHIGQIFNEYDRTGEHLAFFRRLEETVAEERPDALLVCGDIFHNPLPSAQSQNIYTEAVLSLKKACPGMTIVITAGNHDSGSRLEVYRKLWDLAGVKVTGCLSRSAGKILYRDHIIRIPSVSDPGETAGFVIALPYIYRQNYPAPEGDEGIPEGEDATAARQRSFYNRLMAVADKENTEGLPTVMMAHMAVTGCDITGHDEPIGGMEYVPYSVFPEGCDYLALGHIHRPQTIRASGHAGTRPVARYSGSPIPLNFDEDYGHSISVVEMERQGDIKIREVEIPCSIPVLTLPEMPVPFEEALQALRDFPDDRPAYIRLNVLIRDFLPQNAVFKAVAAAQGKACRYCSMKVTRTGEEDKGRSAGMTADEIRSLGPVDVARLYYRNRFGCEMDGSQEQMLEEIIGEIRKEDEKE